MKCTVVKICAKLNSTTCYFKTRFVPFAMRQNVKMESERLIKAVLLDLQSFLKKRVQLCLYLNWILPCVYREFTD